jgi:hypothetical protein
MVELAFNFSQETDAIRRMHLSDRIQSLGWVLRCYRTALDTEERLVLAHR